jgi:hypothetical protein
LFPDRSDGAWGILPSPFPGILPDGGCGILPSPKS